MSEALGVDGESAFDLLPRLDTIGGVVFTSTARPREFLGERMLEVMSEDDLAWEMRRIHNRRSSWDMDERRRFSLAGSQGKFTFALVDGVRFWPTMFIPSTHIVKPDGAQVANVAAIESATLSLAEGMGIDVLRHGVLAAAGVSGLVVERFDRARDAQGRVRRLRTEDLTQTLGAPAADKYDLRLADVARRLRENQVPDEVMYDLFRQVAYNAHVGNGDAHAKNYSLVLSGGPRLSPLYDSICMGPWPEFRNGTLGFEVNGVVDPWELTLSDWQAEGQAGPPSPPRRNQGSARRHRSRAAAPRPPRPGPRQSRSA